MRDVGAVTLSYRMVSSWQCNPTKRGAAAKRASSSTRTSILNCMPVWGGLLSKAYACTPKWGCQPPSGTATPGSTTEPRKGAFGGPARVRGAGSGHARGACAACPLELCARIALSIAGVDPRPARTCCVSPLLSMIYSALGGHTACRAHNLPLLPRSSRRPLSALPRPRRRACVSQHAQAVDISRRLRSAHALIGCCRAPCHT